MFNNRLASLSVHRPQGSDRLSIRRGDSQETGDTPLFSSFHRSTAQLVAIERHSRPAKVINNTRRRHVSELRVRRWFAQRGHLEVEFWQRPVLERNGNLSSLGRSRCGFTRAGPGPGRRPSGHVAPNGLLMFLANCLRLWETITMNSTPSSHPLELAERFFPLYQSSR
jgi:hypothetical protein